MGGISTPSLLRSLAAVGWQPMEEPCSVGVARPARPGSGSMGTQSPHTWKPTDLGAKARTRGWFLTGPTGVGSRGAGVSEESQEEAGERLGLVGGHLGRCWAWGCLQASGVLGALGARWRGVGAWLGGLLCTGPVCPQERRWLPLGQWLRVKSRFPAVPRKALDPVVPAPALTPLTAHALATWNFLPLLSARLLPAPGPGHSLSALLAEPPPDQHRAHALQRCGLSSGLMFLDGSSPVTLPEMGAPGPWETVPDALLRFPLGFGGTLAVSLGPR